ncbi:MAG: SCO1664 family protein [Chloroflexota bacterium]
MPDNILAILQNGGLSLKGEFRWGSNYTFLIQVNHNGQSFLAVYKPSLGERPLWDFPAHSLTKREVAAYLVSQALGWHLIPPTVYRLEAPHGPGSLQQFIQHDPQYHYFNFRPEHLLRLRPVALLDVLINNADRKGSHLILDPQDNLWAIDHGVCFHEDDKLRTVIWDFAGEPIPEEMMDDINSLCEQLERKSSLLAALSDYLTPREISAILSRSKKLTETRQFPYPPSDRRAFPYPLI